MLGFTRFLGLYDGTLDLVSVWDTLPIFNAVQPNPRDSIGTYGAVSNRAEADQEHS